MSPELLSDEKGYIFWICRAIDSYQLEVAQVLISKYAEALNERKSYIILNYALGVHGAEPYVDLLVIYNPILLTYGTLIECFRTSNTSCINYLITQGVHLQEQDYLRENGNSEACIIIAAQQSHKLIEICRKNKMLPNVIFPASISSKDTIELLGKIYAWKNLVPFFYMRKYGFLKRYSAALFTEILGYAKPKKGK